MNQEDLLKKTGNILKELQDQFDFLARKPEKLSELELELFLANAHFLTDHVQILKKVATSVKVHALPEHTDVNPKEIQPKTHVNVYEDLFKPDVETPTFEFEIHQQSKETPFEQREDASVEPFQAQQPEEQEKIIASEQEEIIASQDETILQQSNPISEPILENVFSNKTASDNQDFNPEQSTPFQQEQITPYTGQPGETVAEPDDDEIGPEPFLVTRVDEPVSQPVSSLTESAEPIPAVKHQPNLNELLASKSSVVNINISESGKPVITDLKSAINLNEKLLFIKDLFDGYNLAYAEAIDLLNKMPDFNAADKFLKANYATKHQWASKPGTVEQLYELLHQRFPK